MMTKEEMQIELDAAQQRLETLKQEVMRTIGVIDFLEHALKKEEIPV